MPETPTAEMNYATHQKKEKKKESSNSEHAILVSFMEGKCKDIF